MWARTMLSLGKIFFAREEGDRERNLAHAAAAYRQALRVFPQTAEDWAETILSLADIERPGERLERMLAGARKESTKRLLREALAAPND